MANPGANTAAKMYASISWPFVLRAVENLRRCVPSCEQSIVLAEIGVGAYHASVAGAMKDTK